MNDSDPFINEQNVDWSLATWEGARREQMRRWAALPLERAIMASEEMETLATELQAAPSGIPMPSNCLEQGNPPPGFGAESTSRKPSKYETRDFAGLMRLDV